MKLTIPYPPTMNNYWRNVHGRTLISRRGREFRKNTEVAIGKVERMSGELQVEINAYVPDKRRRDLDNLLKPLLDAMQHAGVYEDDSQICDLRIRRAGVDRKDPRVEVLVISEAD